MCFSANASFGAGAVLTVIGVITVAKTKKPSQLAFAVIPFLFGVQQIIEGCTWLILLHPQYAKWEGAAIHSFIFFAHVLWPVWVPFAIFLQEEKPIRRKILAVILFLAVLLSISEVYCLFTYPAGAVIIEHHINYDVYFPQSYILITEILYIIVTLVPCFLSGVRRMWLFGYSLTLTLVMSAIFYKFYLISVWCFFAAITSVVIYFIIESPKNGKPGMIV
jgi:hypothetical protein